MLQQTARSRVVTRPQAVGSPVAKMLTHVGSLLHKEEEALKIHSIKERLEPYLEGPTRSRLADAHETKNLEK